MSRSRTPSACCRCPRPTLYDGSQIRHEYSAALIRAAHRVLGKGDRQRAMQLLEQVEKLLDTYEQNGGKHYGLYSLRAELYCDARREREAQAAINEAWKRGWRATWRARHDPFLAGVTLPAP